MKKILSACVSVLVASAVYAADMERTWNSEDTAPGIRVHNGWVSNIAFNVTNTGLGNLTINDGVVSSNIVNAGLLTIEDLAKYIRAYTNGEGKKPLTVDINCLPATQTTSNILLIAAITNSPGQWNTVAKIDTSNAKFFSTYFPGSAVGGSGTKKTLKNIFGSVGGTSNITVRVYADGALTYQKIIPSPIYRLSESTGLVTHVADNIVMGEFDLPVNLPFGASQSILIKADRASTATTGGLGASAEVRE